LNRDSWQVLSGLIGIKAPKVQAEMQGCSDPTNAYYSIHHPTGGKQMDVE
jgi:hypothetical protein